MAECQPSKLNVAGSTPVFRSYIYFITGDSTRMKDELNELLDYFEKLGQRAIACKHWQWKIGMSTSSNQRVIRVDSDGYVLGYQSYINYLTQVTQDTIPDLSDPATLGCLLAVVRDAHRDPRMFVEAYSFLTDKWRCMGVSFSSEWVGPTEAEALIVALESAA